ncbi:hypothetical protein [Rufibacter roseus]|uniref:Uncharacterized protein n=1 Tax=Rufibacter roseus TaxID=1567108 RepID=A0ABW2DLV6_9BACT|nr:hypothetical protein [Rufibacter roseus]
MRRPPQRTGQALSVHYIIWHAESGWCKHPPAPFKGGVSTGVANAQLKGFYSNQQTGHKRLLKIRCGVFQTYQCFRPAFQKQVNTDNKRKPRKLFSSRGFLAHCRFHGSGMYYIKVKKLNG